MKVDEIRSLSLPHKVNRMSLLISLPKNWSKKMQKEKQGQPNNLCKQTFGIENCVHSAEDCEDQIITFESVLDSVVILWLRSTAMVAKSSLREPFSITYVKRLRACLPYHPNQLLNIYAKSNIVQKENVLIIDSDAVKPQLKAATQEKQHKSPSFANMQLCSLESEWEMDATGGNVNPVINNLGDRFPRRGRTLAATQTEIVPANASLQARLLESGNNPIHPSVQEAIGAGHKRNDRRLPGLDTAATTIGGPVIVISYVNAAIDTTAIGFKRRRLLIKNQLMTHLTLGFDTALNIETLVAAAERRETPIEAPPSETQDKISFIINNLSIANIEPKAKEFTEVLKEEYYPWFAQYMVMKRESLGMKVYAFIIMLAVYTLGLGPDCIFTLTAIAKWECSSYGRALALHARGTGFDSPHFLIFSLCQGSHVVTHPDADIVSVLRPTENVLRGWVNCKVTRPDADIVSVLRPKEYVLRGWVNC
nr:CCR4-Not transcription complex subunit 1 isoform X2 [Tanacetum cinerariifolium]